MGRYYSLDLRQRVASFVEAGHSRRAAARRFGVSDSCAIKLAKRQARFGSPAPDRQGRPPGSGRLVPYEAFLVQAVRLVFFDETYVNTKMTRLRGCSRKGRRLR